MSFPGMGPLAVTRWALSREFVTVVQVGLKKMHLTSKHNFQMGNHGGLPIKWNKTTIISSCVHLLMFFVFIAPCARVWYRFCDGVCQGGWGWGREGPTPTPSPRRQILLINSTFIVAIYPRLEILFFFFYTLLSQSVNHQWEFLPWEIWVAFPKESQLQQSHATQH